MVSTLQRVSFEILDQTVHVVASSLFPVPYSLLFNGGKIAQVGVKGVMLMPGLNRMIITGNLTKDPEIRFTKEEIPVAKFTVAVDDIKRKDKDTKVNYFNCIAWRGLANVVGEYVKKGSLVAVEGKLQIRPYEINGQKKQATEIIVDNLMMLDKKFHGIAKSSKVEDQADELVMA